MLIYNIASLSLDHTHNICADIAANGKKLLETLGYGPAHEYPALAEAWLEDHGRSLGHFIGWQEDL